MMAGFVQGIQKRTLKIALTENEESPKLRHGMESITAERARIERVVANCKRVYEKPKDKWSLADHFEIARYYPEELDGERLQMKLREMVSHLY